jgi:ferric-dicitrate binding protein FerR (iron transport regulator)
MLARYVSGTADPAVRSSIEARLLEEPELQVEIDRLRVVWESAAAALHNLPEAEIDSAWRRLTAALELLETSAQGQSRRAGGGQATGASGGANPPLRARAPSRGRWRNVFVAGTLLAAAVAAVWTFVPRAPAPDAGAPVAAREFVAEIGVPLSLTLADGSLVILAPGSRLSAVESDGPRREVNLEGRAYFSVRADPQRPFFVHASGTITRVLGTSFDVRAFPGTAATEVVVRSGRVTVRPSSAAEADARSLSDGDRAIIDPAGPIEVQHGADVDALLGWTAGNLVFRSTPLRDVVPELEAWFGLDIMISDSVIAARRITATFAGEPAEVVLDAVAELVAARVERTGREVIFVPFRSR